MGGCIPLSHPSIVVATQLQDKERLSGLGLFGGNQFHQSVDNLYHHHELWINHLLSQIDIVLGRKRVIPFVD